MTTEPLWTGARLIEAMEKEKTAKWRVEKADKVARMQKDAEGKDVEVHDTLVRAVRLE